MPALTISQVARQAGLRPSAIRYYEQIGILLPPHRANGRRRYDQTALYNLAIVGRARQVGFTLDEIRRLFFGFRKSTPVSARWKELSVRKLAELDAQSRQIASMQQVLQSLIDRCHCTTLEQCGRGIFEHPIPTPLPLASPIKKPAKPASRRPAR